MEVRKRVVLIAIYFITIYICSCSDNGELEE